MGVYYGKFKSWAYSALSWITTHRQFGKKVASQIDLKVKDGDSILEGGCGWGRITIPLAKELKKRGIESIIHAYDFSPEMLKRADKYARKQNVRDRIKLYQASAENLSCLEEYPSGRMIAFEDNAFDAAFYAGLFECVDDKEKALEEQLRVIKTGGQIWLILVRQNFIGQCACRVPMHRFNIVPEEYFASKVEGIENLKEIKIKTKNLYLKNLAGVFKGTVKL